jgi:hypothetical protein
VQLDVLQGDPGPADKMICRVVTSERLNRGSLVIVFTSS